MKTIYLYKRGLLFVCIFKTYTALHDMYCFSNMFTCLKKDVNKKTVTHLLTIRITLHLVLVRVASSNTWYKCAEYMDIKQQTPLKLPYLCLVLLHP